MGVAAASRRAAPNGRTRRMMPRQARKPCSGCGRRSGIRSQKGSGGWADRSGGAANAFKGPIGVAPVARRHVLGKGGVPVVAAAAPMRRDPLTLEKDLDGLRGQPHLDLVAREAVRDTVKVSVDLDVVIDTDTTHAPFGKAIGLGGQ